MTSPEHPTHEPEHFADVVAGLPSLEGRTVAVTGSTSGTGAVFASTAASLGARVVLLNRPSPRATASAAALEAAGAHVVPIACDLQRFESVRLAAADVAEAAPDGIDVLCNNAGVMGLADVATPDGCDVQMQTNHLSHFLLTSLLWPLLAAASEARGEARVVNHSSGARRGAPLRAAYLEPRGGNLGGDGFPGFGKWRRYQQSKLANLLFTYALSDRMPEADRLRGMKSVCAHPGPTDSGLQAKTAGAGGTRLLDRAILRRTLRVAHSVEDGTMGILCASFEPDVDDGQFYGPAGRGEPGPAVLLPPERDPAAERLLWDVSERTTGVTDFFGADSAV
ncbi:short-chain dehydrogenase [Agromyces rhizosphaerae]|uniref:Short-chain dehydrogenase n=1 Tax=Agromyces rhizosphaerae TaxID=88374 RepID=A0A9W6D0M5_9MICO|nr:SDR family NAD(P)-dependent oxidoreductase [Agromyces rhizosphaerae]GLI28642.1 short-chain dehydrogenase [Agromyces rhizosphaerae]